MVARKATQSYNPSYKYPRSYRNYLDSISTLVSNLAWPLKLELGLLIFNTYIALPVFPFIRLLCDLVYPLPPLDTNAVP